MIVLLSSTHITTCPRCEQSFDCRPDDSSHCHCSSISLSAEEREYLQRHFDGCLCALCLSEIKEELSHIPQ